ncbi:uncharacterized protein LOC131509158 [Neofelis nebulosa]|uniref:uncharacterized protein LOC131509158 n=1 Tax=Neofelis nebulosa TaxID=61452 RepID=UPI00272B9A23|nr:uncharacterized protein LOC131509158 [Neofelis nebulosa]
MNASSENAHFEGSNARPFFYVHAMGQQPYLSPWCQSPTCNPFSVPGAGFRNGSLYFPYSVVLSEYPGFLVPQSPLPITLNRRPMFYNTAQFQHYSGYGKKMKTRETQTEPQQAENMTQKQDTHSEGDMVTSIPTSNIDIEMDDIPEETDGVLSSVAQKRELHGKSPSNNRLHRTSPHGSYACEKEKMRLEQSKGSPVTQFWKTLKETMRLYDLAYGKAMPEKMVQDNRISQSSWESRTFPHEGTEGITCKDEESTVWLEQCHDVRHDDVVKLGSTMNMNLGKEKNYATAPQSPDEAKDRDRIQDTLNSNLCPSSGDGYKLQQERSLCSSNKAIEDLSLQSKSQSPLSIGESMPDNGSGGHGFPVNVDEVDMIQSNSSPENYVPPPILLAQFNQADGGIQCDTSQWQDEEHNKSPKSSPESRKATQEKSVRCGKSDEVVERDSYPKYVPSPARLAQMYSKGMDEGIQCDMIWLQDAELEKSPEQMPYKDEESSPDCRTKGSQRKSIRNRKLNTDEEEVTMNDEVEEEYHENFKKCAKIKKTVKDRKPKTLNNSSSGNRVYLLKKNATLNTVLPEDLEDCELEEEVEDEMYVVECLFEEVSPPDPVNSLKGRIFCKASRIIRMPPEWSLSPQLIVWPTRNKDRLKHVEYESIPMVYEVTGQDGRIQRECMMAMQKGLESKTASHKSWECNCERRKTKVPYKVSNRFDADAVKLRKQPAGTEERNF